MKTGNWKLERLIADISQDEYESVCKKYEVLFERLGNEYQKTIEVYLSTNFSIKETASELHIHRNTLQYRLDQMKEKVGLDPFIPFIIAAALKTAQGSSTAALVITSSLIAPLLPQLGITGAVPLALVVMAIGAGAMVVSHVNDSYFWVVKEFSGMSVTQAYKAQTTGTLIQGIVSIIVTFILWMILV